MALAEGTQLLTRAVLRLERIMGVFRVDDFPPANRSSRIKLQLAQSGELGKNLLD